MQQGAAALKQLGVRLDGISSHAHFSFSPDGQAIGCYGRSLYSNCQPALTASQSPQPSAPETAADIPSDAAASPRLSHRPAPVPPPTQGMAAGNATNQPTNQPTGAGASRHNMHVPRQMLRMALLRQLAPGTVEWGSRVAGYTDDATVQQLQDSGVGGGGAAEHGTATRKQAAPDPEAAQDAGTVNEGVDDGAVAGPGGMTATGGVQVHLEGGRTARCRVLVGADGIFSPIRRQKLGDELVYLGTVVMLGFTTCDHPLTDHRIFQTLDGITRM